MSNVMTPSTVYAYWTADTTVPSDWHFDDLGDPIPVPVCAWEVRTPRGDLLYRSPVWIDDSIMGAVGDDAAKAEYRTDVEAWLAEHHSDTEVIWR